MNGDRALRPAAFLDKDGTLVENVPYNVDPERTRFTNGAVEGLRLLQAAGYRLVVISNQAGVARGVFPERALARVRQCLALLMQRAGVTLAGFYYCPHHPEGSVAEYRRECLCRKPAPGLILQAAQELRVDLRSSWFVGDILDDVEAGRRAGCRTVLINNGLETEWRRGAFRKPHHVAADLKQAAALIVGACHDRQR
jgi:D,D-heptose 1,7-bisphosphate phosphatase